MFFKKYKVQKTQKKTKFIVPLLWTVWITIVLFLWVKVVDTLGALELQLAGIPVENMDVVSSWGLLWIDSFSDSKNNKTQRGVNVLLLWKWWGNHDAPELTDTIIVANINVEKGSISMLSIPRDLYVKYPGIQKSGKINRVYETFLYARDKNAAIQSIKNKVSEITGQPIDFYVNIDFEGFIKIIDILGWVEVTVPENFVDYEYPDGKLWYTTFVLRKWTWTLDWEVALKYARSRHSTSDFDRSLRQQQILAGLKDKVLKLGYFKDNKKIRDLYNAIDTYIETDIDLATLVKLSLDFSSKWDAEVFSFNLNDTCFTGSPICEKGGFLYVPQRDLFWWQSVLLVEWTNVHTLSNYSILEPYMSLIFEHQEVFLEKHNIAVYNATKTKFLARSLSDVLKKYGFSIPVVDSTWNIREKKFEKSILYYNGIDSDDSTLKVLKNTLDMDFVAVEFPQYSDNPEVRIEIILGEDFSEIEYLELNKEENAL